MNEIFPPCINSTYDYLSECGPRQGNRGIINCPSLNEDFLCFYEPTGCKMPPPLVKNATISTAYTMRNGYVLHGEAEYSAMKVLRWRETKALVVLTMKAGPNHPNVHERIPMLNPSLSPEPYPQHTS